jgi:hypothetical protein
MPYDLVPAHDVFERGVPISHHCNIMHMLLGMYCVCDLPAVPPFANRWSLQSRRIPRLFLFATVVESETLEHSQGLVLRDDDVSFSSQGIEASSHTTKKW